MVVCTGHKLGHGQDGNPTQPHHVLSRAAPARMVICYQLQREQQQQTGSTADSTPAKTTVMLMINQDRSKNHDVYQSTAPTLQFDSLSTSGAEHSASVLLFLRLLASCLSP